MPEIEDNDPAKAEDTPTGQEKLLILSHLGLGDVDVVCEHHVVHSECRLLKSLSGNKIQVGCKI